jgi:hypothetical protein
VTGVPIDFQVTVDAAAPHDLADWWAATLGWQVEPTDESFIRKMIAQGHATDDETLVHHGTLAWKAGAAIVHPGGPASGRPRVLFQLVPEAKAELHRGQQGPQHWVTMADPEGNEFCVG